MNSSRALTISGGDEPALIARALQGDLPAFDGLVERHQERVFHVCLLILGDRDEAADAAQETFVKAYRFLGKFRGECAFSTWVSRIALNCARDAAKSKKRAPTPFSAFSENAREEDFPETSRSPHECLVQRQRSQALANALQQLPEKHRTVLLLYDLQGHSYEDVAYVIHVPVGTVKSGLNRARALLRKQLEPQRELFMDEEPSR
jgi:RNA polymerase sigma-70 factor (ECF subfamily)